MNIVRLSSALTITVVALLLTGCASASKPSAMVPTITTSVTKHTESVSVAVAGGSETSSMGASKIANADFAEAISDTITQSGLFANVGASSASDYALGVQIVRLDQPVFGLSFTVTLETTWRLSRRVDGNVVWEKAITTPFTATAGDSLSGVTRLRLANEGAARANIQEAVSQISALKLP